MRVFKCDICKAVFTAEKRSTVGTNDIIHIESAKLGKLDMCNTCHDRLVRWVWSGEKLSRLGV